MKPTGRLTPAHKWVLVLAALTLVLGFANVGRAIVALRYLAVLPTLRTRMPLGYAAVIGGIWGAVFILCSLGLFLFRSWGRRLVLGAVTLYQVNIWVNHLLFDASDYARQTRLRDLVLTASLLILYWGTLNLRAVKEVFSGLADGTDRDPGR